VYRTMGRLDPIAQTLHPFGFGAVVAAVKRAVFLQAVAHDLDAAMSGGASAWMAHSKLSKLWVLPPMMT
jgi:hypothetical protein